MLARFYMLARCTAYRGRAPVVGMGSITRRQGSQDRFGGYAIDFQYFSAARRSRNDTHTAFRDAEMLGNEIDQGEIGGIFDRWSCDADLDQAAMRSGQLGLGGARLYVNLDAY